MVRIQTLLRLPFLSVFSYSLVAANKHGHSETDDSATASKSLALTSLSTRFDAPGNSSSVIRGDRQCPKQFMCIIGTLNGSTVTYELQSTGSQNPGWMAIGFGTTMENAPMVIMWENTDGTITLSQRQSTGHMMPTAIASPTNVATAATSLSTLNSSQPVLAFTIAGSAQQVPLIWAYGNTRPAAAADSILQLHDGFGKIIIDLTKTFLSSNVTGGSTSPSSSGSDDGPLLPYERTIVAHAIIATFGFLILLPSGVLLARYVRTISTRWYTGHWIIQVALGGPVVIVGCGLGILANHQMGSTSGSAHKTMGILLLGVYVLQCFLGAFIHYVKFPFRFGRPPQNYAHAVLGLAIISLALYQVYTGYHDEWLNATGRGPLGKAVTIIWIFWAVVLAFLYFGGLAYLPRQWRQEHVNVKPKVEYQMTSAHSQELNKLESRFI